MLKILFNGKNMGKIQDNGQNKMSQALDYLEPKIKAKELEEGTIQIIPVRPHLDLTTPHLN